MEQKLGSLGLSVRASAGVVGERRVQLYLDGYCVAWFQSNSRLSDGVHVVGINIQRVLWKRLSVAQTDALRCWLFNEMLEAEVVE